MSKVRDALAFHEAANNQLDMLIAGEERAKTGLQIAMILRANFVSGGAAGCGKSKLSNDAWRLMLDVTPEDVVHLMGQHDISASQLVGAEIPTEQEERISSSRTVKSKKLLTRVNPLIKPTTKWVDFDEINLGEPHAVQSVLPVLETREIRTTAGAQPVKGLRVFAATLNPTDSNREVAFRMSERMASRFKLGVMMGESRNWPLEARQKRIEDIRRFRADPTKGPEKMQGVITNEDLDVLYSQAMATPIAATLLPKLSNLAIKTVDILAEGEHITEDTGRLSTQVEDVAKTNALLTNEKQVVREEDLHEAVRYVVAARLAILRKKTHEQVDDIVSSIVN